MIKIAIIGSAYVQIRAITDRLEGDIQKQLSGTMKTAGDRAGKDFNDAFSRSRNQLKIDGNSLTDSTSINNTAEKIGKDFSNTLNRTIKSNTGRAGTLGDFAPKINTNAIDRDMDRIVRSVSDGGGRAGKGFLANFGEGHISGVLQRLFYQILFGIPAVGALIGALSSLVSGLFAVASAAAPAASALAVLPGIFAAVGTAAIAGAAAFAGIGDAYSAGIAPATGAAASAAKSIVNNQNAIADATEAVARAQESAAERIADAQRNVADAYESAREAVESAQRSVISAERGLADALRESNVAQLAVNKAREEARNGLIELQFSVEQAAISEGKAAIELERAREKLAEVNELPVNHRLRREAELNYRQAILNLDEATKKSQDTGKEQEEAAKKGVEGSDLVVKAREDEAKAAQDLLDAQQDLADSSANLAKTRVQSARDVQDAEVNLARTVRDSNRSVADAQKSLERAMQSAASAAGGAAGGVDKFAQAMAKLSPQAQAFVRYLISIKGEFDALRAAAGADLFPRLTSALQTLISGGFLDTLATGLQTAGRALGDIAVRASELFTSPFFQGALTNVLASNETVLNNMGTAILNLISYFTIVADAARPFTEEFTAWIATVTGNWSSQAQSNFTGLQDAIGRGVGVAKQLGGIFGGIVDAIGKLGSAAQPAGQTLLDSFQGAIDKLNEFLDAPGRAGELQDFFSGVADNVRSLGDLVNALTAAFLEMGDDPAIGKIADILRTDVIPVLAEVLDTVTEQVGPHMAEVFGQVVGVFGEIANSGGLNAFLDVIGALSGALLTLSNIPGFSQFITGFAVFIGTFKALNFAAQITGLRQIPGIITGIGGAVKGGVNGVRDFANGLKGIQTVVGEGAGAVETGLSKFGNGIRNLPGNIRNAASATKEFVVQQAALVRQQAGAARAFAVDGVKRFGDALKTAGAAALTATKNMGVWIATQARAAAATAISTARILAQRAATVASTIAQNLAKAATIAWTGVQWLLNAALNANPLGLIVIAITAVIAAIVLLWQNSETFRNIVLGVWEAVKTAISAVASWFTDTLVPWIQGVWDSITSGVQAAWDWVLNIIKTVAQSILDFFMNWTLIGVIISNWDTIKEAVSNAWNFVLGVIQTVGSAIASYFSGLWNNIVSIVTTVWNAIVAGVTIYINTLRSVITTVFNAVSSFLSGVWNGIKNTAVNLWNGIVNTVTGIVNRFKTTIVNIFTGIRDGIANVWNGLGNIISGAVSGLLGIVRGPVNAVVRAVNGIIDNINNMSISIPDWVPGLGGKTFGLDIPKIPQLAMGGTVSAVPGGILANIGEGKYDERVTPLDSKGRSSAENEMIGILSALADKPSNQITIVIQATPETDVDTLATAVSQRLAFLM